MDLKSQFYAYGTIKNVYVKTRNLIIKRPNNLPTDFPFTNTDAPSFVNVAGEFEAISFISPYLNISEGSK
eukprot:Pgem_evm1s19355